MSSLCSTHVLWHVITQWLLGDYLVKYYSLCDIGILAPVFVMVISSGFVLAMSSGFVSAV